MKEKILSIIERAIGETGGMGGSAAPIEISVPDEPSFGHYATNVAMRLAHARGKKPMELAKEFAAAIEKGAPAGWFEKVEAVAPGFINIFLTTAATQKEFAEISRDDDFGADESMQGKTVMVEFTDPNPFKLFHIGHLMSNTIGESFARLYEASGATVIRANYQGDVGLHVAKSLWGMQHATDGGGVESMPSDHDPLLQKMEFLGKAYAAGSVAYENDPEAKESIVAINEKIYLRSDAEINRLYDMGREWSLAYFETVYQRLGTKFDRYFFEGALAEEGMHVVREHKDVFVESDGAIIFPGEKYGLHTRVFINSKKLPTYEAKELGLNKEKFKLYPLDLSVILTASEQSDYFKVLLKAMEFALPEIARRTRHLAHGILRLPSGKMSSRTGDVITAESLLDQTKLKLSEKVSEKTDLKEDEREAVTEAIAVGAIKYSILKQNPGQDIIFDFEKSLSFEGDAGPYVQYAYARLRNIMRKSEVADIEIAKADLALLDSDVELALMRKVFEFPDVVTHARERYAPSALVAYVFKLASVANKFYETTPILKDENLARRNARLLLIATAARTLKSGLNLLGIKALEKI